MATTNPIVTSITGYVCDHNDELFMKSILSSKSSGLFNLMPGVKGKTNLHEMGTEVVFGDGSACGWSEAGTTTFSNRELVPAALKVNMAFCDKKLLTTWAQHKVRVAAGHEVLPFEEKWTKSITEGVAEKVEKMLYQGNSANGNEFDGLIKIAKADTNVIVKTVTGGTAYAYIKAIAAAIPAKVKNPVILVSIPLYREFMQDLVTANLYHYNPGVGENEYFLPGTDIKVIAVAGLNSATDDAAFALDPSKVHYGISGDGDDERFDLWYSKDNKEFRLDIEFIAGVQYEFGDEIVRGERK